MIVFDLKCGSGHVFEAWFGSSATYEAQRAGGQVQCPICGDAGVDKAVMAPAVAAKGNSRADPMPPSDRKRMMQEMAKRQAELLETSTWVGGAFAEQARALHAARDSAGEEENGGRGTMSIHGQATLAEARELIEDGIPVAPLPFPVLPPDAVN